MAKEEKKEEKKEVTKEFDELRKEIQKEARPSLYDETKHWAKFNYLEQPDQVLEFTFGKTIIQPSGKKSTKHERYKLYDGGVYELPQYIIDHLNKITVPDPRQVKMPNGMLRVDSTRKRNRFSVHYAPQPSNHESQ